MPMTRIILVPFFTLLAFAAGAAFAQQIGPTAHGRDGKLAVTAAMLPITHEAFVKLWESPRTTIVDLPSQPRVEVGSPLLYVLFFRKPTAAGAAISLFCEISLVHPDGTLQKVLKDRCGPDKIPGPASDVYVVTSFGFGAPDIPGQALGVVSVVTDQLDGESVSVATAVGINERKGTSP